MITTLKGFDVRLDAPVKDCPSVLKVDLVEDPASLEESVFSLNSNSFRSEAIFEILGSLPPDEKAIIQERFFSDEPKTLRDLAKDMKISREWVRKLEIKALSRMKKRLASQYDIRSHVE